MAIEKLLQAMLISGEPIIKNNGKNINQVIDSFLFGQEQIKKSIEKGDLKAIAVKFENARIKRDAIPKSKRHFPGF